MGQLAPPSSVYLMAIGWRLCGVHMDSLTFALLTFAVLVDWDRGGGSS